MVREPSTRPKVETGEVDVSRNCVGIVWDMSRWRRTRLTCLPEQSYEPLQSGGAAMPSRPSRGGGGAAGGLLHSFVLGRGGRAGVWGGGGGGIRRGARRGAREGPRAAHVGL